MKADFILPEPHCACGTIVPQEALKGIAASRDWLYTKCGLSEKAAIEKCMLGDSAAFTLLFALYQYPMYAYVRWKLKFKDPEEAFEVLQRAMFAGWQGLQKTKPYATCCGRRKLGKTDRWEERRNRSRFRGAAQLGTWLVGIAKNVALEMRAVLKRDQFPAMMALDEIEPTRSATMQEPLAPDYRLVESAMQEQMVAIEMAIDHLPAQQRRVLLLRLAGHKHREIAVELGLAASTCRVAHRDALHNLRKATL